MATRKLNASPSSFDAFILFSTRTLRLFGYGFLSIALALYLSRLGLAQSQIGSLLTLTLLGDTVISLWLTSHADRLGRRRVLMLGALLMLFAGILFTLTRNFYLLLIAATIGVISPSGYEVGPFLPVEQASLTQLVPDRARTRLFAWYNLAGSFATALGALVSGVLAQFLQNRGFPALDSYRIVILGYAAIGLLLLALFSRLSQAVEVADLGAYGFAQSPSANSGFLGLHTSQRVVFKLSLLFSLDAFAGGFIVQSLIALWFDLRFSVSPALLGSIFFFSNILGGISYLFAAWIAARIGLVNTMVFTHLPSNILLMTVPLMPSLELAVAMLLLRSAISQMDVPSRQSYVMAVVEPRERSAAAGITGVARTIGASLSPVLTGFFLANPSLLGLPFFLAGSLKILYDLALYRGFRRIKPPEEL